MSNLLFLAHRIPYPPNKGDKIRSFHLIKHLSERHDIYLGGFIDNSQDWEFVDELRKYCVDVTFVPVRRWKAVLRTLASLFSRRSLSIGYYKHRKLKKWVNKLVGAKKIDLIITYSSVMAQFIPEPDVEGVPVIADFVDVDSDKWSQFANEVNWPWKLIYRYEAAALARWESSVADRVNLVLLVSSEEVRLFSRRLQHGSAEVQVVRNGVDLEFFDPAVVLEDPYRGSRQVVVFTGAMDYLANVQGVAWFAAEVWPNIRNRYPDAEFWIVGSNPTAVVEALVKVAGIVVTGRVDDIRPFLKFAAVAVAPLHLARGVQNKVLEALAMDRPVVATPQALQGLDGVLPKTVTSAVESADFEDEVLRLFSSYSADMLGASRAYVGEYYEWSRNLSDIDALISSLTSTASSRGENAEHPE